MMIFYMSYDIKHAMMMIYDVWMIYMLCVRCYSREYAAHPLATIFFRLLKNIAGSQGVARSGLADSF